MFFSDFLKLSRDVDVLISLGNAFHSFGAEAENDPSYRAVFDLGTELHVTDRKLQSWVQVLISQ